MVFSSIINQLHLQNDTLKNGSLAMARRFIILNCKHVPNLKRLSKINQKLKIKKHMISSLIFIPSRTKLWLQ
jgi:hypothetical protein